jgi:hypothetical protein
MRHIEVMECRVADGSMVDFVSSVQRWERRAMDHEAAPIHHAVLVDPDDPARIVIITQFADQPTAQRFAESGMLGEFMEGVMQCSVGEVTRRGFELFYASGSDGPRAIFGEVPRGS